MDSLGEKAGTRERGRRWGEGKINGASKGPEGDPVEGTAVVPRFDDEREFSRKQKSILGYKNA